ncbi:MAG: hypothetical protein HRU10_09255 [Opitutales bacterium]|nr:hypothetical protein [Opitutales bacterium]
MEFLIGVILVIGFIISFVSKITPKKIIREVVNEASGNSTSPGQTKAQGEGSNEWLKERWNLANESKAKRDFDLFPKWYFDPASENQLKYLEDLGVNHDAKSLTKGQASDLIGLQHEADDQDIEVLKFFKVSTGRMNQTRARHEAMRLLSEPQNAAKWEARPPSAEQKEFFKFFGLKAPKGLTLNEAEKIIRDHKRELSDKGAPKLDEWEHYEDILDQIADNDTRDDYDIRKPSAALIRQALKELNEDGMSYEDVVDDLDVLIEKLITLKPDLQKG